MNHIRCFKLDRHISGKRDMWINYVNDPFIDVYDIYNNIQNLLNHYENNNNNVLNR